MAKEQDYFTGLEQVGPISTLNVKKIYSSVAGQMALNYRFDFADSRPILKAALRQEKGLPISTRLARKVARVISLKIDEISIMSDQWREEVGIEDGSYIAVRAISIYGEQYYLVPQIEQEEAFSLS